uniref:Reverse transcriptase domain-containing protein n=1 Tax=Anolis carolinensis TaxID=28377 RepID=R4GAU6_ANOCA
MSRKLKIYSNNVNGINEPQKRNKIFNKFKKLEYDIISLQEVHIKQGHAKLLTQPKLGQEFHSLDFQKKRGVVTYISPNISAELSFKDNEGRILGVMIKLENLKILICNIYAPNESKSKFVKKLKEFWREKEFDGIILMGDFNGVLNNEIDKNPVKIRGSGKNKETISREFKTLKEEYNLIDIWRSQHEKDRDFTFFSARHKSWSRIDMIWISRSLSTKVTKSKILPMLDSDHCPTEIILNQKRGRWRWRLDENLLKREEDIEKYRKLIEEFFTINNSQGTSPTTVWDASKVTMRGYFLQQSIQKKRKSSEQINQAIEKIIETENKLKKNPKNNKLLHELIMRQRNREYLELEQRAKQLKYIKQNHFENANKPGRWLSRKLRKKREATFINRIKIGEKYLYTDKDILDQFHKFYSKLYESDNIKEEKITRYLGNLKLERLTPEERELLNKEISIKEIEEAIRRIDGSKAPGPDGLTAIYYKTFKKELAPQLQKVMNIIRNQKKMPDTWKEASITVIHKENNDPEEVKNYRPISLLNIDYKIFSNIIADRLKKFLTNWIKDDQVGFLPNRHIKDNIRIVLDLIEYYEANNQREMIFLAIDAEKAFDRVNWNFFKFLAQELDMGYYFQNILETIYQNQTAKIIINGQETDQIEIQKGTRQGCPLSPVIFIMTLEVLLNKIREDKELQGTVIQGTHYKVRAYADDLICFIEDPVTKGEKWIETIKEYGDLAGFKMNISKTKALAKNIQKKKQDRITEQLGVQITPKIKYLGINITSKNIQLLKNNYEKTWNEVKKEFEIWKNLKLSLMGRMATIKMNVLPKMLFLFQCLPILRNQKNFTNWNKDISKFIWNGRKPRIKIKHLTDDRSRGGIFFAQPEIILRSK